jgi:hypothetical protein
MFDPRQVAWFDTQFYPTPPWCTEELLSYVRFVGSILEPCCGQGHISKVLVQHGNEVESCDIVDWGYGAVENFFLRRRPADNIVTNPSFRNALNVIRHARRLCRRQTALLLPTAHLSHTKYVPLLWPGLKLLIPLCPRPKFRGNSPPCEVGWYVWERGYTGDATVLRPLPAGPGGRSGPFPAPEVR